MNSMIAQYKSSGMRSKHGKVCWADEISFETFMQMPPLDVSVHKSTECLLTLNTILL
jgi:hypothetical protein